MDYSQTNRIITYIHHKSICPGSLKKFNPNKKISFFLSNNKPNHISIGSLPKNISQDKTNISCSKNINHSLFDNYPSINNKQKSFITPEKNRINETSTTLNKSNSCTVIKPKKMFAPISIGKRNMNYNNSIDDIKISFKENNKVNKDIIKCEQLIFLLKYPHTIRKPSHHKISIEQVMNDFDCQSITLKPKAKIAKLKFPKFEPNLKTIKKNRNKSVEKKLSDQMIVLERTNSQNFIYDDQVCVKRKNTLNSVLNSTSQSTNCRINFKQKVKDITPFYLDKRQSDIASITKKEDIRNNRFLNHFENAIKYNRISFIDENRIDSKNNILTRLKHKLNSKIQLINDNTLSNKFSDLLQKEKNLLLLSLISTSNETTKKGDLFIEPLKQFTSCKIDIPLVIYLHSKYLQINSEHLTEYLNQKQCDLLNNFNLFEKIKHLRSMKTILRSKLHKLEHHLYLNKANCLFIQNKILIDFIDSQPELEDSEDYNKSTIGYTKNYRRLKTARSLFSLDVLKHKDFFVWRKNHHDMQNEKDQTFIYEVPIMKLLNTVGTGNFIKTRTKGTQKVDLINILANSSTVFDALMKLIKINDTKLFIELYQQKIKQIKINQKDKQNGNTLLIYAIKSNAKEIIKFLLESGADTNIENNFNNTALHYAFSYKNYKIADLLTNYGAKENIINKFGMTPWECIDNNCEEDCGD